MISNYETNDDVQEPTLTRAFGRRELEFPYDARKMTLVIGSRLFSCIKTPNDQRRFNRKSEKLLTTLIVCVYMAHASTFTEKFFFDSIFRNADLCVKGVFMLCECALMCTD